MLLRMSPNERMVEMEITIYDDVEDAVIAVRGVRDILECLGSVDSVRSTSEACLVLAGALDGAEEKLSEALEAMGSE